MILKKIISSILAVAMVAVMSTTVFAEENSDVPTSSDTGTTTGVPAAEDEANVGNSSASASTNQFSVNRSQLTPELLQQADEQLNSFLSGESDGLEVGERKELGTLDGLEMFVEVREEPIVSRTRGVTSTLSKTFYTMFKDFWGNVKEAFKVDTTCTWYDDGPNSYLTNLAGTYTVLDNSFWCEWDTASGSVSLPGRHALYMYAHHGASKSHYTYTALLNAVVNPVDVRLEVYSY